MKNLVEHLKEEATDLDTANRLLKFAASEIDRMQRQVKKLTEAIDNPGWRMYQPVETTEETHLKTRNNGEW